METFVNGLSIMFNGLYTLITTVVDPVVLSALLTAAGLAWLARIDIAELDRQGAKPSVERH